MKIKKHKKNWRLIMSFMVSVFMSLFIVYKMILLQYYSDDPSKEGHRYTVILDAKRGNILSDKGKVLAATVPTYDIYVDFHTINPELFRSQSSSLIKSLNNLFEDRKEIHFKKIINSSKSKDCAADDNCGINCGRYVSLVKNISYEEMQTLKSFPIFNQGRNKGGLIAELRSSRSSLFGELAKVTLGRFKKDNITPHNGIELNFNEYLKGEEGVQVYYRGIPVKSDLNIPSTTGMDVVTTININLQDAVEDALVKKLKEKQAKWGTAVLMEVSTGKVKAIANLHNVPNTNRYTDSKNHAIVSAIPPGSTFKLATLISLMKDGYNLSDMIDTEDGTYDFTNLDYSLGDTKRGGYGNITLGEVFIKSSNIGFAKSVYSEYKDNKQKFIDNLEMMGLTKPLDLQLIYQDNMLIKTPARKDWWGSTLPAMSIGYEMRLSPLHILTFYNAFANSGRMIAPQFVSHVLNNGEIVKSFDTDIVKSKICSQKIIDSIMPYMIDVIDKGTARKIKTDKYTIAGKTGTCEIRFWESDSLEESQKSYSSSFVGFFPADHPKYSCIVVIHDFIDANNESHYGGDVAAPVFRQISDKVYALDRSLFYKNNLESIIHLNNLKLNEDILTLKILKDNEHIKILKNKISSKGIGSIVKSDLIGMEIMDVIYLLENEGVEVNFNGVGRVADFKFIENDVIQVKLS